MDDDSSYPHLFSPFALGGRTLRNRIVHAAMSTRYAAEQRVTDRLIAYYANRARGGAAMIVTESMTLLARGGAPAKISVRVPGAAAGLERWAAAVAADGALLLGQVQDVGRGWYQAGRNAAAIGASALPDDISWTVPRALTTGEVEAMIAQFAQGARILRDAGFAGVELSAGHGHIFHQFLAARSNRRADRFGGDLDARARLLTETLDAIRDACGPGFLIGVKLPGEDGQADGIDLAQAAAITKIVASRPRADYLTWCWGTQAHTLHWHLPDLHGPRAPFVDRIAALARHAPGIAIGALGLITDPNEGEQIVRGGLADLVMLGRPLVTDPAWPAKARAGREAQIRYCVSCNTCWGLIAGGGQLRCDNNPRVATPDETDWTPSRAPVRRRIVIVGAGIAGMEAAWIAAARGHDVTLFGASDECGGKTRLHARLPGGENLSSIYDYQRIQAQRYGARLQLGRVATLDDVLALAPDAVVLATGSTCGWPAFLPDEYRDEGIIPDLRTAAAMMLGHAARQPGTAVILDEDHGAFTYAAAEMLAARFERVVILTPRERIATDEPLVTRQGIYERLYRRDVEIVTSVAPTAASDLAEGVIAYANIYNGREARIAGVALFAYATPRVPDDALAGPLRAAGIEVHLIGDCAAPRSVLVATTEGNDVAQRL